MVGNQIFGFDFDRSWEYENGFYLTSDVSRIGKQLCQWELYKRIVGLPGHVIECGVFKGASLIRFASYRELLESQVSRKIIGFDAFGAFPDQVSDSGDKEFIERFETDSGAGIPQEDLEEFLSRKHFRNIELHKGDIRNLIPSYVIQNPQLKIALLHLDMDVFEPTLLCLELLYERVVSGGIIMIDDYNAVGGATKAVDEFFEKRNEKIKIEKLGYYSVPSYIVKG